MKYSAWKKMVFFLMVCIMVVGMLGGCSSDGRKKLYKTKEQQAVVETALAYLGRGPRIQYSDTRLATDKSSEYRWQSGKYVPEDATSQFYTYTNCAAFTHDVYLNALDYEIESNTTAKLMESDDDILVYSYKPTGQETPEEMAQIEKEFRDALEVADIIVVRYNGNKTGNGHAMLYVGSEVLETVEAHAFSGAEGNGPDNAAPSSQDGYIYDIIHSGGKNYDYDKREEKFEENGSISKTSVDRLFDPENSCYVFSKILQFGIVRPLNTFEGKIPEDTVNRINNMYGIVAEKLSSHAVGMTVNPGEEMTFTFSITNTNAEAVSLAVQDQVPENTTYVSGADTVQDNELSWKVDVAAGETKTVSYTVRVNEDTPYGSIIYSDNGFVGGVPMPCKQVVVANSLTEDEQDALTKAIEKHTGSSLQGFALVNAIYNEVLGTGDLFVGEDKDILKSVFTGYPEKLGFYKPALNGEYASMFVPTMYGGRSVLRDPKVEEAISRTRLPYKHQLMAGDILFAAETSDVYSLKMYIIVGDVAYDLMNGLAVEDSAQCLDKTIGYNRFIVLRPSIAVK